MSKLKIKRNTANSDAPENTQLVRGELAFNEATESLYIGKGTSGSTADEVVNLGGKGLFLALTGAQTAAGNKTFSNDITITGNLTVNGTTTTVNSTTTTVDDPVFTIGGDSAPGSDDNKDRGIEFRYHDGSSARVGFFGYDDSAQGFAFLTAATNSSEVFSGTEAKLIAGSLDISGDADIDGTLETDAFSINGTTVTSTAAELNILDGVTSTAAELNILDGVTSTAAELNILDGVTSTAAELNILDGVTSTAAELNLLDGVTSTTAELNILDGVTASAADINLIDGITNGTVIASKAIITDSNKDITGGRNLTISGELDAATLDISGNADIDGTLEADEITVGGATLASVIAGTTVTTATTATNANHVLLTDNEDTDENNVIPFGEGATATGNVGLESDGDFHYNPYTGTVTAGIFDGTIDGGTWS